MTDEEFAQNEVPYAEKYGNDVMPDGYNQHYTLGGIRVAEPPGNWGRDYWDIADAENAGCYILKPSVFGISGMTLEETKAQFGL